MKYCPHCGRQIRNDALVCPYCGHPQGRTREPVHQISGQNDVNDNNGNEPNQIKYSKAKLTWVDYVTLVFNVLNAATLLFLGCEGLTRPEYINNVGTFVTVVLSLLGIVSLGVEIYQNHHERLPILALVIALIGNVSVFAMAIQFNQKFFLVSLVIILIAFLIFDRELKRTY